MKSLKQIITNIFKAKKDQIQNIEKGSVKFFNNTKGFGFITVVGSEKEIFVHKSGLVDRVRKEDTVLFETENSAKGIQAINVRLA